MSSKRIFRTDSDWLNLIMECRQSGLSDRAWCDIHDIASSSFYNAVTRLRKKACTIPEHSGVAEKMDLTSKKQDVVQIDIVPDNEPASVIPLNQDLSGTHLDNSHTIELVLNGNASLRITNNADPVLLETVLRILQRVKC